MTIHFRTYSTAFESARILCGAEEGYTEREPSRITCPECLTEMAQRVENALTGCPQCAARWLLPGDICMSCGRGLIARVPKT